MKERIGKQGHIKGVRKDRQSQIQRETLPKQRHKDTQRDRQHERKVETGRQKEKNGLQENFEEAETGKVLKFVAAVSHVYISQVCISATVPSPWHLFSI